MNAEENIFVIPRDMDNMDWIEKNLQRVRDKKPLVQNITNYVVMNTTANALLALGAAPVMAHAAEELEDMLKIADSLVINIGTLDSRWVESFIEAANIAGDLKKPVVLDPVGAGATSYRTKTALRILNTGNITVLRGNMSEIASLLGKGTTRGVDATHYDSNLAEGIAIKAAEEFDLITAVTGPIDYVSDGKKVFEIKNGVELLSRVTGTGCMVSAITGAFLSVDAPLRATISALTVFGVSAELAYEISRYPGSFHIELYNSLYRIDEKMLEKRKKVSEVEHKG